MLVVFAFELYVVFLAARTRQRVTAAVWCAIALTFITTLMATVSVQYRSSNPQATEIPVLLTWSIGLAPILLAFVMTVSNRFFTPSRWMVPTMLGEQIRAELRMSKKAFKRALGGLYKARRVALEEGGVRLLD